MFSWSCLWLIEAAPITQMHTQVAMPPLPGREQKVNKHDLGTFSAQRHKHQTSTTAAFQPLSHSEGGIHNHFVMSGENLVLKTFVEPQLAKFSSFTGNTDIWVFLIQKKLLMKSSISRKIDTIIIHYFPVMWNKALTNFCKWHQTQVICTPIKQFETRKKNEHKKPKENYKPGIKSIHLSNLP